jgi:alanine racemase
MYGLKPVPFKAGLDQRFSKDQRDAKVKSWVEVSGRRLVENLRAVQAVASAEAGVPVEVLAVVKANGYGHDGALVAQALVGGGARWLGVSDVEEGAAVRRALGESSTKILVMCGMELGDAAAMVEHGLTPVVWTVEHIAAMEKAARAAGQRVAVHLEIDSGMSRQGARVGDELAAVLERLKASRWVACEGVLSHLSSAEVAGSAVTLQQREVFAAALQQVSAAGVRPEWVHLANSSGVDEGSTLAWMGETARRMGSQLMVRTGLAVYGYCLPVEEGVGRLAARLQPALAWKTRVAGLRDVAAGATVGYGATFVASRLMRLALLPVGYADGFRRTGSSTPQPAKAPAGGPDSGIGDGWVMVAGKRAAVVGRVSMNLTVVDVTGMSVAVGDAVVLLGEGVSAVDHAAWSRTIPYDILCGIRARVEMV